MLLEITIKNFAIIEEISLNFENGMTVLTGETVSAADGAVSHHSVGVLRKQRRSDISLPVTQKVQRCPPERLAFCINPAIGTVQQDCAGPICNNARVEIAAGIDVGASRKYSPVAALNKVADQKRRHSQG